MTRKEKQRVYGANSRERHKDKIRARLKKWALDHPERMKEIRRKNRLKQREKRLAYERAYSKANPDRRRAKRARQRARKHQALPPWTTPRMLGQISGFFRRARSLTEKTGVQHVVDHIVPLRGRSVCGLHVPWNLQILTSSENHQKSNKLDDDGNNLQAIDRIHRIGQHDNVIAQLLCVEGSMLERILGANFTKLQGIHASLDQAFAA